jgi:predicted S18 family serine protease
MTHLNKFLALSILMTVINVPMYFYSKSLGQSHLPLELAAHEQSAKPGSEIAANDNASNGELQENTALAAPEPLFNDQVLKDMATEEKPERFKSLGDLYKPPLFGKCKKLFERFNRKQVADKPYKAFVYSFDGETAYCADAYTDKGQEAAEEIVMRECEAHHSGSGKYSPCRIYASE